MFVSESRPFFFFFQLTWWWVPRLADTASSTAVWALFAPQLQGSALSHETNDTPLPHTAHKQLFNTSPHTVPSYLYNIYVFCKIFFLFFQNYIFYFHSKMFRKVQISVFFFLIHVLSLLKEQIDLWWNAKVSFFSPLSDFEELCLKCFPQGCEKVSAFLSTV